ncbi:MAG: DUF4240 domain-containing protein [Planctomycetota bacterium]
MNEAKFWEVIEKARGTALTPEEHAQRLVAQLVTTPPDDIREFDRIVGTLLARGNRGELRVAANLINDGPSDEEFLFFLGWLILQGREKFEAALKQADSIAEWIDTTDVDNYECEDLLYAAANAYETATGQDLPPSEWPKIGDTAKLLKLGTDVAKLLPKLSARWQG